jgi:D-citramalate synthase
MMLNPDRVHRLEGSHWVSPMNFDPEVQAQFTWPEPFTLIDSTLRKMLFTAGALTSIDGFVLVAEALGEAGIKEESLNITWGGGSAPIPRELALCRAIAGRDFGFRLNVYADTFLSDGQTRQPVSARESVEMLVDLGVRMLAVGIVQAPSPEAQQRQMEELAEFFELARDLGVEVSITLANVGRRDFDSMVAVSNEAIRLGALRLDLMDSTSTLAPEAMKVFVQRYRSRLAQDVPVTMHVHDDFGLATAGAIAAATAGASPDVSIGGVSYRGGFASLEEVVVSLEVLYGVDTGVRLDRIQPLADLVAEEMGLPIHLLKPLIGQSAFLRHMPGDVVGYLQQGADAFPPVSGCLNPRVIGSHMTWVWDSLSNDAMVKALAATLGETLTDAEVSAVRAALDGAVEQIATFPRWLTPEEATRICRDAISASRQGVEQGSAAMSNRMREPV